MKFTDDEPISFDGQVSDFEPFFQYFSPERKQPISPPVIVRQIVVGLTFLSDAGLSFDIEDIQAIEKYIANGKRKAIEEEGFYPPDIESLEIALLSLDKHKLKVETKKIPCYFSILAFRYIADLICAIEDEAAIENIVSYSLLVSQALISARQWRFMTAPKKVSQVLEHFSRGKQGMTKRYAKSDKIKERYYHDRMAGDLKAIKTNEAASRKFIQSLSQEERQVMSKRKHPEEPASEQIARISRQLNNYLSKRKKLL